MKYLRMAIPVLLVVLIGYLYSCDTNKVTNPSSSDSKEILGDSPKGECPDLTGYTMAHMCLAFYFDGQLVPPSNHDVEVRVKGYDVNTNELKYTCNYTQAGNSNSWGFGSRLPVGLRIVRTACVYTPDGVRRFGSSQFIMPSPNSDDGIIDDSQYYITLYDKLCR